MATACPLCLSDDTKSYMRDKNREYEVCGQCHLIFVPPQFHLDHDAEKQVYDFHQNSPEDEGYRTFLNKLLAPLAQRLPKGAEGLDFGCGPGPTIKPMLEAQGFSVQNYDIYYHPNEAALCKAYDFITCTEAIEHFSQPHQELARFDQLLNDQGFLGIMTKRPTNKEAFANWHYKNDPTHICFFSEKTFQWIAQRFNYHLEFPGNDTVIMQKKAP